MYIIINPYRTWWNQVLPVLKDEWTQKWSAKKSGLSWQPLVKYLPFNAGDAGSIPGPGTKIPHAVGQLSSRFATTEPSLPTARARRPCATTKTRHKETEGKRLIPCPRPEKKLWGKDGDTNPGVSDPEVPASNWHHHLPQRLANACLWASAHNINEGGRIASDPQST